MKIGAFVVILCNTSNTINIRHYIDKHQIFNKYENSQIKFVMRCTKKAMAKHQKSHILNLVKTYKSTLSP